jgi:hypothetical protein
MVTTAQDLVTRCRTNINEPSGQTDPLRSDVEIIQWLEDGVHDYMSKVPAEAFPSMQTGKTFSTSSCTLPTDFLKLIVVVVDHTMSGSGTSTVTMSDKAYMLRSDENWLAANWPVGPGAWAQFQGNSILVGPQPSGGTVTYLKKPGTLSTSSSTFDLPSQHEEPIVNYATAMALGKVNDTDAERYLTSYNMRIQAEKTKYGDSLVETK